MKGKVVSSVNKAEEGSVNKAEEGIVLLDAGDDGLVLLKTPKLNDFLPRVSAALLLATKCLRCAHGLNASHHRLVRFSFMIIFDAAHSIASPLSVSRMTVKLL